MDLLLSFISEDFSLRSLISLFPDFILIPISLAILLDSESKLSSFVFIDFLSSSNEISLLKFFSISSKPLF